MYACRHELAATLADVMFFRTRLSVLAADAGASAVERVVRDNATVRQPARCQTLAESLTTSSDARRLVRWGVSISAMLIPSS